jgi:hypothetical protein
MPGLAAPTAGCGGQSATVGSIMLRSIQAATVLFLNTADHTARSGSIQFKKLRPIQIVQDFRLTRKFVIPAKAGIQFFQQLTGFPPARE